MAQQTGFKQIFVTSLTDTNTKDLEGVGVLRHEEDGKVYRWCKYKEGAEALDVVAGDALYYVGSPDLAEVTADISDATLNFGAGVAMAAVTVTDTYLWVQVRGLANLNTLTAGANGNAITALGAANKAFDVVALVTDHVVGVVVDAAATPKKVFLTAL